MHGINENNRHNYQSVWEGNLNQFFTIFEPDFIFKKLQKLLFVSLFRDIW